MTKIADKVRAAEKELLKNQFTRLKERTKEQIKAKLINQKKQKIAEEKALKRKIAKRRAK